MFGDNAVLTQINGPGTIDRAGDVETAGTAIWTGRAGACLQRRDRRVVTPEGMTLVEADVLIVPRSSGAPVSELAGDQARATTVVVEDRRTGTAVTRRFRVVGVENRAAGTMVDSVRLELDDERAS